jgi:hypothetical protein
VRQCPHDPHKKPFPSPHTRMHQPTMTLSADERRALDMLATAGHNGVTQSLLTLYGFHPSMVAELVGRGLVSMAQDEARGAGGLAEVVTVRITEAGRDALTAEG